MAEVDRDAEEVRNRCLRFADFAKAAWQVIEPGTKLVWNWHLDVLCDHLQAITEGRLHPRVIFNLPPGSSKSTFVSVLWQAWEWGPRGLRHHRFVSTSFELENVKRDTRKTRDLIMSEWFQTLWPEVVMKRAGETSFANKDTGSREGVAFSSVMGKRGDRLLVDDPHSLKGAESEIQRNSATRLFIEGGLNRTNDPVSSAIVIVMQRVHQDDLTGALLAQDFGFVHIMIPMEFEPERRFSTPLGWTDPRTRLGELMDPGRIPASAIETLKLGGDYMWAGQYQQRPAPRAGGLFKIAEDWALPRSDGGRIVESVPAGAGETVSGWDLAGSKRKTSPYSVRVRITEVQGNYYIEHVDRRRTDPTELDQMIYDVAVDDGLRVVQSIPQDPGQAGKSQVWAFAQRLAGFDFRFSPETGDKQFRARPFAAQWGAGRVFLVRGPWNAAYIEELRNFPAGTYKDQVDATSRAFAELVKRRPTMPNPGPLVIDVEEEAALDAKGRNLDLIEDPWGVT